MMPLLFLLISVLASTQASTTRTQLNTSTEIQSYPCASGYAWFFDDGKLATCSVSRDTKFGEITIPKGSIITVGRDGEPRFVFLSQEANLNGHVCRGGGTNYSTALHSGGQLKTCWLATDTVIDGIPCMQAGFFADVFGGGVATNFHENGKLKSCKLSRDVTVDGRNLSKGDHVHLDANGKLK